MQDPHALISAYIDGTIDDEGFETLCQWLRESPGNRTTFAKVMADHAAIADWSSERSGGALMPELSKLEEPEIERSEWIKLLSALDSKPGQAEVVELIDLNKRNAFQENRGLFIGAGLAAAVLLLGVALIVSLMGPATTPSANPIASDDPTEVAPVAPTVATLTATHDATWVEGVLAPGSQLRANTRLTLTTGFAEITTKAGAIAILEAPCTVELTESDNALRLIEGKLVGVVETKRAKGFMVRTPSAEIVDLGTRFGVVYDGTTRMQVLEGAVSVKAANSAATAEPTVLRAGAGAIVDADALEVDSQHVVAESFASDWRQIDSQPTLQGEIHFAPSMPESLLYGEVESNRIVIFREKRGVRLPADLDVTVDGPGEHYELATLESTLAAGTTVDSYLVHLDLPGEAKANSRRTATITFDRPILAVISRSTQLYKSDALMGNEGVRYIKGNQSEKLGGVRGMEPATSRLEAIKISEDRRTLTVDMVLVGSSIDQARVLLEAKGQTN